MPHGKEVTTQEEVEARARQIETEKVQSALAFLGMCHRAGVSASVVSEDPARAPASIEAIFRAKAIREQPKDQSIEM